MDEIDIRTKLKGGDRRSLGNSKGLVSVILENPALFDDVFVALSDSDPVVRVRASDVMEKVSRTSPHLLQKWKLVLLELAPLSKDKEVRWHLAQMIPRLRLTPSERDEAVQILMTYLRDSSSIVKTFSMQALADLGRFDEELLSRVIPLIERLSKTGTPAMKSRGRKLLNEIRPAI